MREDWRENRSGEGEERRIEIYICLFIHGEFPLPYRCASKRLLSRLVDDETGAGITSSARRNLKLTPGNREQREPTKMLSAGSVCKHRENATRKSALKKEKALLLRFRGVGACRFCYSLGMKLKGREEARAISILFVRVSSYWCGFLIWNNNI